MTPPSAPTLHPKRCETCDYYDVRDTVQMGEWISVGVCSGKRIYDGDVKFVASHGCCSHSSTAPDADARQRIEDVVKELEDQINALENMEPERGSENWCAIQAYKRAIALLKDGGGKK